MSGSYVDYVYCQSPTSKDGSSLLAKRLFIYACCIGSWGFFLFSFVSSCFFLDYLYQSDLLHSKFDNFWYLIRWNIEAPQVTMVASTANSARVLTSNNADEKAAMEGLYVGTLSHPCSNCLPQHTLFSYVSVNCIFVYMSTPQILSQLVVCSSLTCSQRYYMKYRRFFVSLR